MASRFYTIKRSSQVSSVLFGHHILIPISDVKHFESIVKDSRTDWSVFGKFGFSAFRTLLPGTKVGTATATVLAAFAIFLFTRRYRKQQATQPQPASEVDWKGIVISEFSTSANKHELPSSYPQSQELESHDYCERYEQGHELYAAVPGGFGSCDPRPPAGPIAPVVANSESLVRRKAVVTETENDDDPELERTEVEIEALRVEKEQRLQDPERREGGG